MNKETVDQLVELEIFFLSYVFNAEDFELIAIPDFDGAYLTEDEIIAIHKNAADNDVKVGYQVLMPNGDILIFSKDSDKLGVVYNDSNESYAMQ